MFSNCNPATDENIDSDKVECLAYGKKGVTRNYTILNGNNYKPVYLKNYYKFGFVIEHLGIKYPRYD